jgi:heme exporter protein CcmD
MNNDVYVWASYVVTFALLALEVFLLWRRWRRLSR